MQAFLYDRRAHYFYQRCSGKLTRLTGSHDCPGVYRHMAAHLQSRSLWRASNWRHASSCRPPLCRPATTAVGPCSLTAPFTVGVCVRHAYPYYHHSPRQPEILRPQIKHAMQGT